MGRAFISYTGADKQLAVDLATNVDRSGHEAWIDVSRVGRIPDWEGPVFEAIARSEALVALVSDEYFLSPECQKELEHARKSRRALVAAVVSEPSEWGERGRLFTTVVDLRSPRCVEVIVELLDAAPEVRGS